MTSELPGAEQWGKGDLCELAHIRVVLDGRYHCELADGRSFDVNAGEMYDVPAGLPHSGTALHGYPPPDPAMAATCRMFGPLV
jgi:hypothetical protein